jgi:aspartokinase-like uncharacterized kinase
MPGIVVKVGGSLFDWPQLGPRLRRWLTELAAPSVLLVPGGGPTADAVRDLDCVHGLGEEKSHWLALRALTLNAHFLADLLPESRVVTSVTEHRGGVAVLDPLAFCLADERDHPADALPHSWSVTSDSVAARVAVASGAGELLLLKSITVPPEMPWEEAAQAGHVDGTFAGVIRRAAALEVRAINFRAPIG